MNNKGFTLVELLAVITILGIVFVSMISLNVFKRVDETKALGFVSNAKIIISKAEAMYNNERYTGTDAISNVIYLKDIDGITNISDPFGGTILENESYVLFDVDEEDGISLDKVSIYLKACDNKVCHMIGTKDKPIDNSKMTYKDVKEENK